MRGQREWPDRCVRSDPFFGFVLNSRKQLTSLDAQDLMENVPWARRSFLHARHFLQFLISTDNSLHASQCSILEGCPVSARAADNLDDVRH